MSTGTLINIVIIVLIAWFAYSRMKPAKGLRNLNAEAFKEESVKYGAIIIDVREPGEFKSGFIPGARNIPLSQLSRRLGDIPRDKTLLLYCRSGMRSKNAAALLRKNGYSDLAHLQGGISAWKGKLAK